MQDPKGMIPAIEHVGHPEGAADGNHTVFPSDEPATKAKIIISAKTKTLKSSIPLGAKLVTITFL